MNKDEFRLIYRQQFKKIEVYCYLCGKLIKKQDDLTADHEPPKSRQAELGKSELYPCCKRCNHLKGSLTVEEFRQWLLLEARRNGNQK